MITAFPGAVQTKGPKVAFRPLNRGKTTTLPSGKKTTTANVPPTLNKTTRKREQSLEYADEPARKPNKTESGRARPSRAPTNDDHRPKRHRQSSEQPEDHEAPSYSMDDPNADLDDIQPRSEDETDGAPSDWIQIIVEQRKADGYQQWYDTARETVRNIGHFVRFERVLRNGLKNWNTPLKDQPWTKAQRYNADVEDMLIFEILLQRFEGLVDHISELRQYTEVVKTIASFLDSVLSKTRSDDLARLNLHLFEHIEGVTNASIYKEVRGFKDVITGRELLPPDYLAKYHEDPTRFLARLENGQIFFKSGCLPSFLINLDKYDCREPMNGFLEGKTLSDAIVLIYNGPKALNSSRANHGKSKKGQRSIAKKYGVTELTTEAVIYVAGLVRHVLCTASDWNEKDGQFDIAQMTQKIKNMCLRNPSRIRSTMSSYSTTLFGKMDNRDTEDEDVENNTTYAHMMAWDGNEIPDEPGAFYHAMLRTTTAANIQDEAEDDRDHSQQAGPSGTVHGQDDEGEHAAAPAEESAHDLDDAVCKE